MLVAQFHPLVVAACIALLISVPALWLGRYMWIIGLTATVAVGYVAGALFGPAIVWIGLLAGTAWLYRFWTPAMSPAASRVLRVTLALSVAILAILLATHALPGFRNSLLAKDLVFSPGAAPYRQYLNFDKTVAGLLILGIIYQGLMRTCGDWLQALRRASPIIAANIVIVVLLALALGYVRFDPKWTSYFWLWATVNLFFTCMSEEAFFRGFIQRELATALRGRRYGDTTAMLISAALFGLLHFAGGWTYVGLSAVAGLGYAMVFRITNRIEMAILAHFALNATHFLFLTYPRVA